MLTSPAFSVQVLSMMLLSTLVFLLETSCPSGDGHAGNTHLWANITFDRVKPEAQADVRIALKHGKGYWSRVGMDDVKSETDQTKPTMNLGPIDNKAEEIFSRKILRVWAYPRLLPRATRSRHQASM
ncbi:hypothetical protein SCUP234_04198 [Seiridium cupressi]